MEAKSSIILNGFLHTIFPQNRIFQVPYDINQICPMIELYEPLKSDATRKYVIFSQICDSLEKILKFE